jgi:hypothetical protein
VRVELDPGGRKAWLETRKAQHREPRPTIEPTTRAVRAEMLRRRELLREKWEPIYRDDEQRPEVPVAHDPNLS